VDQDGIVKRRHAVMRLGDPLRLGRGDQDVPHGGEDERARPQSAGGFHQGEKLGGERPAAEREQLGDDRVRPK
jgi:hypothetical protein